MVAAPLVGRGASRPGQPQSWPPSLHVSQSGPGHCDHVLTSLTLHWFLTTDAEDYYGLRKVLAPPVGSLVSFTQQCVCRPMPF